MINIISNSGHTAYGLKEFILDTEADIQNLPIDITTGSTAFVIDTTNVYMLNGEKEWVKI